MQAAYRLREAVQEVATVTPPAPTGILVARLGAPQAPTVSTEAPPVLMGVLPALMEVSPVPTGLPPASIDDLQARTRALQAQSVARMRTPQAQSVIRMCDLQAQSAARMRDPQAHSAARHRWTRQTLGLPAVQRQPDRGQSSRQWPCAILPRHAASYSGASSKVSASTANRPCIARICDCG